MIERTYRCNLCGNAHDVGRNTLYGLEWVPLNTLVVLRAPHQVEHHICRACYTSIRTSNLPIGIEQAEAAE